MHKPATYEVLKAIPDDRLAQIIDGDLIIMPRPAVRHAMVTTALCADLVGPFGRRKGAPGGWLILREPEVHVAADIVVPDLSAWKRERLPPEIPADLAFFTVVPDWVCEVLSPSTASIDRVKKSRIYAREGVRWRWTIDPIGRTLEADELRAGEWARLGVWGPGEKPRVQPFDAIELELDAWWGTTPPAL
jgi:Uma2 family endonuclease